MGSVGLFRIVDFGRVDELVGWKRVSGFDVDGLDVGDLGFKCALDVMDGV
jgi:hypothetical protein